MLTRTSREWITHFSRRVVRTAELIIGTTLPSLQELYSSRVRKGAGKITLDPSHPSLNYYRLVDATELWAPERPDTGTVSSLKQLSHEHLTLNVEHTTLLYIIYSLHILINNFKFAHIRPVHTALSILYIVFVILYIAYFYNCILFFYHLCPFLLLSFCCTVELLSL